MVSLNIRGQLGTASRDLGGTQLLRGLAAQGADVTLIQDTAVKQQDTPVALRLLRDTFSGADKTELRLLSAHVGQGRDIAIGGLATVAEGEFAKRLKGDETDSRGWGRYDIATIQGRGGCSALVVNVYVPIRRRKLPGDEGDSLFEQLAALATAARGAQRPGAGARDGRVTITDTLERDPVALMLADLTAQLKARSRMLTITIVIAGDFNIDGRHGHEGLARMQAELALAEIDSRARLTTTVGSTGGRQLDRVLISAHKIDSVRALTVVDGIDFEAHTDHRPVVVDVDTDSTLGEIGERCARRSHSAKFNISDKANRTRFVEEAGRERDYSEVDAALDEVGRLVTAGANEAEWRATNSQPWGARTVSGGVRALLSEATAGLHDVIQEALTSVTDGGKRRVQHRVGNNTRRSYGDGWSPEVDERLAEYHDARVALRWLQRGRHDLAHRAAARLAVKGYRIATQGDTGSVFSWEQMEVDLGEAAAEARKQMHGRKRTSARQHLTAKVAQNDTRRAEVLTRRTVDRAMGRRRDGAPAKLQRQDGELTTDGREMAEIAQEFGHTRGNDAQPHWSIRHNIAAGHEVWVAKGDEVVAATVVDVDGNGEVSYTTEAGAKAAGWLPDVCLRWQVSPSPTTEDVRLAAADRLHRDDTHPVFALTDEGDEIRRRITAGDRAVAALLPPEFGVLLPGLQAKVLSTTGAAVCPSDYAEMVDERGATRKVGYDEWVAAVRHTPARKAPGNSGITSDMVRLMPKPWHERAARLVSAVAASSLSPEQWRVDLTTYIHKGGADRSLANYRPIMLLDVLYKIMMRVHVSRMNRDWRRLGVLTENNAGFQKARTTACSVLPIRMAASHCMRERKGMAVLFDDLAWAFDTPPRGMVELALARLGVPPYLTKLLRDIDNMALKDTVLAGGQASTYNGKYHRVLHGTPQGSVEGPALWMAVADIVVDWVMAHSQSPVVVDGGPEGAHGISNVTFVDDSGLAAGGERPKQELKAITDASGLMYYFCGCKRRPKKCVFAQLRWENGELVRASAQGGGGLDVAAWVADWSRGYPVLGRMDTVIPEADYDYEFRHLGYTASLSGCERRKVAEMKDETRRVMDTIRTKRSLRKWTRQIIDAVIHPKLGYQLAFSTASVRCIDSIEAALGTELRHGMRLSATAPWGVVAGAPERAGMGYKRLHTAVMQARLQILMQMHEYGTAKERSVIRADLWHAQIWVGSSTPVTELSAQQAAMVDSGSEQAPWTALVLLQLAHHGYRIRGIWRNDPPSERDVAIMEVVGMTVQERRALHEWRRRHSLLWLSQLLQPDGKAVAWRWRKQLTADMERSAELSSVLQRMFPSMQSAAVATGRLTASAWWRIRPGDAVETAQGLWAVKARSGKVMRVARLEEAGHQQYREVGAPTVRTVDDVTGYADAQEVAASAVGVGTPRYKLVLTGEGAAFPVAPAKFAPSNWDIAEPPKGELLGWRWWHDPRSAVEKTHGVVNERISERREVAAAKAALDAEVAKRLGDTFEAIRVEFYADGSVMKGNEQGSAAVVVYVDGRRSAAVAVPLLAPGRALSSTRTERFGVLLIYELARDLPPDARCTSHIDNRGAVRSGSAPPPWSAKAALGMDDRDVENAIHELKRRRQATGRPEVEFSWVEGHAVGRLPQERITIHHYRNEEADKLTKAAGMHEPIVSVFTTGAAAITYQPHGDENCETEGVVTARVRRHMASTAALRTSLEYERNRNKRQQRTMATACETIDTPTNPKRAGRHRRVVREAHGLMPDGARLRMYAGGQREAMCICGCLYSKHAHIWLACAHPVIAQVRCQWKAEIVDLLADNIGQNAGWLGQLADLWEIRGDGTVPGAQAAETASFSASFGANVESMRGDGEGGAPYGEYEFQFGGGEADGGEPCGDRPPQGQEAYTLTGPDGEPETYDLDWNGMRSAPDRQSRAMQLLRERRAELPLADWWMRRVTKDVPALIGHVMGLDRAAVRRVMKALFNIAQRGRDRA